METAEVHPAVQELLDQSTLSPGTTGWWKVWGARAHHVLPGDIIAEPAENEQGYTLLFVEDTFQARSHPMRSGLVIDGERTTFGNLAPIVVFRRGTKNTLA